MNNLQVGTVNLATVIRNIDTGYVLDIDDQEVLLHLNDTKQDEEFTEEDEINVFLYNDKNEQIIATTLIPTITRDTFGWAEVDRKSTRLNSSHVAISYAVFCLKKKTLMRATCHFQFIVHGF